MIKTLRSRRLLGVASTAAAIAAAGVIAAAPAAKVSQPSSHRHRLTERRILRIALSAAARAGDAHPILIRHSEGTRHLANLVDSGDLVPGQQWSILIAERGHFVADGPRPPGVAAPRGSVLTLVVNATTGQITDSGLAERYPRLGRLGPVTSDLPAARATTATQEGDGSTSTQPSDPDRRDRRDRPPGRLDR